METMTGRLGQKPRIVGNEGDRALIDSETLLCGQTNSCIPFGSTRPGFSGLGLRLSFLQSLIKLKISFGDHFLERFDMQGDTLRCTL